MDENQTPERIFNFLKGLGYGFNNEKGMLEHCRDGKNLLKIVYQVLRNYEPAHLRSIIAVESHGLSNNLEKHRESLPLISDFLVAKNIFKTTNFTLELKDFLPLPQSIQSYQNRKMAILSHLYAVWNWMKEVHSANELGSGRLSRLQSDHRKLIEEEGKGDIELEGVKMTKTMERQAYEEKMRQIAQYKQKMAQQRSKKNELAALKGQQNQDLISKANELEQIRYRTQQLQIEINQARRELSINAPEVRKEKLRQDAFMRDVLERKDHLQEAVEKQRQNVNKRFNSLELSINKLKHLTFIEALEARSNNLRGQFNRLKRKEDEIKDAIRGLEAELAKMEAEVKNEESKEVNNNEMILQLKLKKSKTQDALQAKKNELGNVTKGIAEFQAMKRQCSKELQQIERKDIEECSQYEQEMRRLMREVQEWNKMIFSVLGNAHSHLNTGFFERSF